ncbi:ACP S-malonyltransferase [Actinomadura macrotermitis]|uniref:[acyl-carrier-protein] S-malonyltransferase n=1 Tax=Actinomadura macrotermitis TaxID=2585200 RepID=A0A7K0C5R5_9ACTN|nr:hypothetical protein [Actinomadura macrotermitis]
MALADVWSSGLEPADVCAFLFPGTGSSGVPDLRALAQAAPGARQVVEDVVDAVQEGVPRAGWPSLREILLIDPASYREAARTPGVAQLAGYTASVAVDRVLRSAGVRPGLAVGQSFGEIAALVCAGAFGVGDGARMAVSLVGVLASRGAGGGMGLLEAGEDDTARLIERAGEPQVVVACLNAPQVTVVSGPDAALDRVLAAAREGGTRAVRLAVPYLSHHPAMAGADDEWYKIISGFGQRPLRVPVYSPVRGRAYGDDDDLHRALADCIVKPVRLPQALVAAREAGVTVFAEAGAGGALTQCARLAVPGARTLVPLRELPRASSGAPPVGKSSPSVPAADPPGEASSSGSAGPAAEGRR